MWASMTQGAGLGTALPSFFRVQYCWEYDHCTGHSLFIFVNQHYIKWQMLLYWNKKKREEMDFSSLFLCLDYDSLCGSMDALVCFVHSCPWKEWLFYVFLHFFSEIVDVLLLLYTFAILSSDFSSKLCLHFNDMQRNTSLGFLCVFSSFSFWDTTSWSL